MNNKEIAGVFNELARIMELYEENPFKIRSYQNAYRTLRKIEQPLAELSEKELAGIKGVGKAISSKIRELVDTGELQTLNKYLEKTPEGIRELLQIKGFGPKKVKTLWDQLGVESVGELLYACNENRLVELKGFGQKTQEDLRSKLEYFQQSRDKFHYARLEPVALELVEVLQKRLLGTQIQFCGQLRRRNTIVNAIELLVVGEADMEAAFDNDNLFFVARKEQQYTARLENGLPVYLYHCSEAEQGSKLFRYTATPDFMEAFIKSNEGTDFRGLPSEAALFEKAGLPFIEPELREEGEIIDLVRQGQLPALVQVEDIKGVVHSHSTYSDGIHSLREMATFSRDQGFAYLGITDHSKSAFYANGLKEDRVLAQMEEIDQLNAELAPFRIFKGIESDILNDGRLDYDDSLLEQFDFIIASVHSNLRMDEAKATQRLLTAIENPYTTILGHPTGRLLLSRKGYPIDHAKVIDACAANGVAIELNANPYRLDLDWRWIPYALEKGVMISINPDAHSKEGIGDIRYGVFAARKGRLSADRCLNCLDAEGFANYISR
ncbi:MAG: helix-hairpin-helix domain-containing protein [Bacteroidota bacterium]